MYRSTPAQSGESGDDERLPLLQTGQDLGNVTDTPAHPDRFLGGPVRFRGEHETLAALFDDGKARFVPLDAALEGQPAVVDLPAETLLIDHGRESLNEGDAVVDAGNGPQAAAGAGAASPDDSR